MKGDEMKIKFLLIVILLLIVAGTAFAELPLTLFTAAAATGAGTATTTPQTYKTWACQVEATQALDALVVNLEGNVKGTTNYDVLATHTFTAGEKTAKHALFAVVDFPVTRIRGNITTLTWTSTAGTVSMSCLGVR